MVQVAGFKLTSDTALIEGENYSVVANGVYPDPTFALVISTDQSIEITTEGVESGETNNILRVASDVTANITLNNVNIDRSAINYDNISTFEVLGDANIILKSENTLNNKANGLSKQQFGAGLQVEEGASVNISGDGKLTSRSTNGAGIGADSGKIDEILITGGTVTATGGNGGDGVYGVFPLCLKCNHRFYTQRWVAFDSLELPLICSLSHLLNLVYVLCLT